MKIIGKIGLEKIKIERRKKKGNQEKLWKLK